MFLIGKLAPTRNQKGSNMRIEFHADGQFLSAGLREHAEVSLRRTFKRFARRVRKVRVYLWDVNGPRGGIDKGVRLIVELIPTGEVLVRQIGANGFASLAGAVARARQSVREELRRQRDQRRRSAPLPAWPASQTSPVAAP